MSDYHNYPDLPTGQEKKRHPPFPLPHEAFLVLIIALASSLLLGVLLVKLGKGGIIAAELLFIIPPLIYLRLKGYQVKHCLRWNAVPPGQVISSLIIGLGLIVLLDEMDRLVSMLFPMPAETYQIMAQFLRMETWSDYILILTGTVLIAAVCEESLFRGFIQLSLEAYSNITKAVLFSALLFALAHFNPWWMIQILILGIFLGFVSWRANSAIPTMFIHGLNNTVALIIINSAEGDGWGWYTWGDHVSPLVLIAAAVSLIFGIKIFVQQTEMSFNTQPPEDETTQN